MTEESSMQGNLEINKEEGSVFVSVNPKIYPLDVVLSSAYIFTDKYYILVDGDPNEEIIVEIRLKEKGEDIEQVGRAFNNSLIDYANYAVQAIKNKKLREAILNRVLLTNVAQKPEELAKDDDYLNKEAKPWEIEDSEGIISSEDEKSENRQDKE